MTWNGDFAARFVLRGNVDRDLALVVDVVGLDDQRLRVFRIDLSELLAGDAGIEELGFLRVDDELLHLPLGNALDLFAFRRGHVLRPDDEIVIGIERRVLALFQHLEGRGTRVVELAHRRRGQQAGACESGDQKRGPRLEHEIPRRFLSWRAFVTAFGQVLWHYPFYPSPHRSALRHRGSPRFSPVSLLGRRVNLARDPSLDIHSSSRRRLPRVPLSRWVAEGGVAAGPEKGALALSDRGSAAD